jgi:hypothetical protein
MGRAMLPIIQRKKHNTNIAKKNTIIQKMDRSKNFNITKELFKEFQM